MLESMWNSLSSSMQLAEECLKQEAADIDAGAPLEGLELFAQTIDSSNVFIFYLTHLKRKILFSFDLIQLYISFDQYIIYCWLYFQY
jgi:hypothetical protein